VRPASGAGIYAARVKGFASDNYAGVHPDVLAAIAEANAEHATPYGHDPWTARAEALLREHFGEQAVAFLVFNGSAANVLALRAVCRPWESVICPAQAHINVDECGAPEAIAGCKLHAVATPDAKLTPALVEAQITRTGDEHAVQQRLVSISQSTELGTLYSAGELRALADVAHARGLALHVDGGRKADTPVSVTVAGTTAEQRTIVTTLDAAEADTSELVGEAVVFLEPALAEGFAFLRKQTLQLASKGRFLAAQFIALLEGDLWRRNAAHANAMAARLHDALAGVAGVTITQPVQVNGVFAVLPPAVTAAGAPWRSCAMRFSSSSPGLRPVTWATIMVSNA